MWNFYQRKSSFHSFILNREYSTAITGHSAAVDSYTLWHKVSHEHEESYMAGNITGLKTPMQLCVDQYTLGTGSMFSWATCTGGHKLRMYTVRYLCTVK
jgi:hypothetical protein